MKILYSLPHPADRLGTEGAGHVVRAAALLAALSDLGHEVIRMQAAQQAGSNLSVGVYRRLVRRVLPRALALSIRDTGRIRYGKAYGSRLMQAVAQHRPDVILETHIAFSLAGTLASRQSGVPLALDDCAPAWEEEREYGVGLRERALSIHRQVIGQASLLVAVNETIRRHLLDEGASPEKVVTVPNGIDPAYFAPGLEAPSRRIQLQIPEDAPVIVYVGSFQPYHCVDLLLRAFHLLSSHGAARLLLVGEGQTAKACEALAVSLGLSDLVIFTGAVSYVDVPSYISAGDIAVLPATSDYTNPMKLYEYMVLGKAVVAPRQANIAEIVSDGKDAMLFEPGNASALAEVLGDLLSDQRLREHLGKAARSLAASQTWQNRALTLEDALLKIARRQA